MQNQQNQEEQKQKNKSLFVVSSAIHANHGVYKTEERMAQTIETCKSIRERVKDCDIILLDGGTKDISEEEQKQLDPHIQHFYSYADSDNVKEVQKSKNWDIVKNLIEIMMFGDYFGTNKDSLRTDYSRIFKMSGRYTLNDNFDYDRHMNAKEKILIRGLFTSQFPSQVTGGIGTQYMSRLWSFDSKLIDYISAVYEAMFMHMRQRLTEGGYVDIEHLLCYHLDHNLVEIVSKMGLQGNIAPNGQGVSD